VHDIVLLLKIIYDGGKQLKVYLEIKKLFRWERKVTIQNLVFKI